MPGTPIASEIASEPDLDWEEPEALSSECYHKIFFMDILGKADAGLALRGRSDLRGLATLVQTKLNFRQLETSTRPMVQTSGSYHWMAGPAQPSAAPQFWYYCLSLDCTAPTPRVEGSIVRDSTSIF